MNNLHAPTVPSGPTTARAANGNSAHLSFAELQRSKDNIEAELKALSSVLDSHGVDMHTSLLTPDGFPRADIDVAQIRTARARIIYLRNDYKDLMARIEKHIHEHFASLAENATDAEVPAASSSSAGDAPGPAMRDYVLERLGDPFAKINTVAPGSPAASAGLQPGDLIRNFGYVDSSNHDELKKVAECVQGNAGQSVLVKISRPSAAPSQRELQLTLVPRQGWGGRGMLGCHILPL
ncbi:putative 26S proteasome regulatory subunit [Diaporthe australafricana]|uniref:26S proteasome regulatory subunit n=1 Tax=Diaporthe australafricana TaxID=127596 RepID=A0ABR3XTB6_9PEZI